MTTDGSHPFSTGMDLPGVPGIWDSLAPGKRHIDIQFTREGQAAGLKLAAIGRQLRANYHGRGVQEL